MLTVSLKQTRGALAGAEFQTSRFIDRTLTATQSPPRFPLHTEVIGTRTHTDTHARTQISYTAELQLARPNMEMSGVPLQIIRVTHANYACTGCSLCMCM